MEYLQLLADDQQEQNDGEQGRGHGGRLKRTTTDDHVEQIKRRR